MAVEVYSRAWPVKSRGDLFDVRGFAGSVISLDHHAPVMREPGENRQGRVRVEFVGGINLRHPFGRLGEAVDKPVGINPECFADGNSAGRLSDEVRIDVVHDRSRVQDPSSVEANGSTVAI